MILSLPFPENDPAMRGGRLLRWHVTEGDKVMFGEPIVDLAIDQFMAIRKTRRAALLARAPRSRAKLRNEYEVRQGKVAVEMSIVSSENVVMVKAMFEPGDSVTRGVNLGLFSSDAADVVTEPEDVFPPLRVALNISDRSKGEL